MSTAVRASATATSAHFGMVWLRGLEPERAQVPARQLLSSIPWVRVVPLSEETSARRFLAAL